MTSDDIVKIGEEMIKVIEPVYEDLGSIKKTLSEHTDKIDALTLDMVQLQNEVGVIKDDILNIKDDVNTLKDDVNTLKNDVGTLKNDVKTLKTDMVIVKEDVSEIKQDLKGFKNHNQKEHNEIKKYVRMPLAA